MIAKDYTAKTAGHALPLENRRSILKSYLNSRHDEFRWMIDKSGKADEKLSRSLVHLIDVSYGRVDNIADDLIKPGEQKESIEDIIKETHGRFLGVCRTMMQYAPVSMLRSITEKVAELIDDKKNGRFAYETILSYMPAIVCAYEKKPANERKTARSNAGYAKLILEMLDHIGKNKKTDIRSFRSYAEIAVRKLSGFERNPQGKSDAFFKASLNILSSTTSFQKDNASE